MNWRRWTSHALWLGMGIAAVATGLMVLDLSSPKSSTAELTPEARREAEALRTNQMELTDFWNLLTHNVPPESAPEAIGFERRARVEISAEINNFRARMIHNAENKAIRASMLAAADRLSALAAEPSDVARRERARTAVNTALEVTEARIAELGATAILAQSTPQRL